MRWRFSRPRRRSSSVTATSALPIRRSQRLRALTLAEPGTERHEVGRLPALSNTIEEYQQAGWEMVGDTTSISTFRTTLTITIHFRKLDSSF